MGFKFMLLVVDVGNTNICLGVFEKDVLLHKFVYDSDRKLTVSEHAVFFREILTKYSIDKCIIGSVVEELNQKLKTACDDVFGIDTIVFNNSLNTGLSLNVKFPEKVGVDRIANAYGALKLYDAPAIVVDSGSATTFDIVSPDGKFIGGVIMPGINLQLESLFKNTSKLPQIDVSESPSVIGDSTESAILSGVIRGTACAIEGLIEQCEEELGDDVVVIGTGGSVSLLSQYMYNREFDEINPELTLYGLKFLSDINP